MSETLYLWIEDGVLTVSREEGTLATVVHHGVRIDVHNGPLPHTFTVQGRCDPAPDDTAAVTIRRNKDEVIEIIGWLGPEGG